MRETEQVLARRLRAWEYFWGGCAAQKEGDRVRAVVLYEKSLSWYPTAEAFTFLGWTSSVQGDFDRAIEFCRLAIGLDPDYGAPYNDIGAYLIEKGDLDSAIPWLLKALNAKRYDTSWFSWLNLGRIQERKGNWIRALELFKKSYKCNPYYTPAAKAIGRIRGHLN